MTNSSAPLVSILLPTLDSIRFLKQRMDSICAQSFSDWEVLVGDSGSADGTVEYIRERSDSRFRFYQLPRGLYQAWNFLIGQSRGKYVYIATSDDTMEFDCLEKMVKALEENPDCDLCDTLLRLIDGNNQEICENTPTYIPHFWHTDFPRDRKHIRRPPYDFFQHFCGKTVYTSITQLLIRRTLFEKTGLFDPSFGRSADFLWGLRAARHASVIFLPEKLASWRIHADQVTSAEDPAEIDQSFRQMSAMSSCAIAEERDPDVREKALFLYRIIPFKEKLLPAKCKRNFRYFLLSLLKAAFCHPLFLTAFAVEACKCLKSSSRRTWLIKSYDHLALRRLRKLDLKNKYVEYK